MHVFNSMPRGGLSDLRSHSLLAVMQANNVGALMTPGLRRVGEALGPSLAPVARECGVAVDKVARGRALGKAVRTTYGSAAAQAAMASIKTDDVRAAFRMIQGVGPGGPRALRSWLAWAAVLAAALAGGVDGASELVVGHLEKVTLSAKRWRSWASPRRARRSPPRRWQRPLRPRVWRRFRRAWRLP